MHAKPSEIQEMITSPLVEWIKNNCINLSSISSEGGDTDMSAFKPAVGSGRVVGLGEANHGSKEFSIAKLKLARFLIEEMDFEGVGMEIPEEQAKSIDSYIRTGEGYPEELIGNLGYWVADTREVLELINWMRTFSEQNPDRTISFFGCDISISDRRRKDTILRDAVMADNISRKLAQLGTDSKVVLWMHNAHIANVDSPNFVSVGSRLRKSLGKDYVNLGLLFSSGSFNAINNNSGQLEVVSVPDAPTGSYEHILHKTGLSDLVLDLRKTRDNPLFTDWYQAKLKIRDIGSIFYGDNSSLQQIDLANKFDCLVWVDKITPSTLLN